jgi:hypothetical protein
MLAKTNVSGFLKDTKSGAIINTDMDGYAVAVAQRQEAKRAAQLQDRVANIENDMKQIKDLLSQLVSNGTKNV